MIELIPLDNLLQSRAAFLICYPTFDLEEAERRIEELRLLGVEGIELRGKHWLKGLQVLGKGNVGMVIAARAGNVTAALKVRRVDADRASMTAEAENLRLANNVNVGPRLLRASKNFVLMELVEGEYLEEWLKKIEPSQASTLRRVLRRLLDDARSLDAIGLDHGELSSAHHHVIMVGDEPKIIDFETASTSRRTSNVTSLSHYLLFNRRMEDLIGKAMQLPDKEDLLKALRRYKTSPDQENYINLINACSLASEP